MRLCFELEKHFRNATLEGDAFFSESQKNAQKRAYKKRANEKRIIERFSVMISRTVKYNTYLLFDAVINSMMWDIPTGFVDIK